MELFYKCLLVSSLAIAGCNSGNNNADAADTAAATPVTATETPSGNNVNGPEFVKQGELAIISKTDTIRKIEIQLALTTEQQNDGLMFRKSMTDDQGMLFVFPNEEERSFWMRNTYIPLDIVYINDKMEIISVQKYTTPLSMQGLPSFKPAKYVLEVNAGFCDKYHVGAGDKIGYRAM